MKEKKFYHNLIFISICFAFWWVYLIPLIIGIVSLKSRLSLEKDNELNRLKIINDLNAEISENKRIIEQVKSDKDTEITTLNDKLNSLGITEYYQIKEKIDILNTEINDNNNLIYSQKEQIIELHKESENLQKRINTHTKKLSRIRALYDSIDYAIDKYVSLETSENGFLLSSDDMNDLDLYAPSVLIKLHCMDIKDLRKAYKENDKLITSLLEQYSSRYTTKANKAIYALMVIALRAELQNFLYEIKYDKLDEAIDKLKLMTTKYLKIAGEGNQSIAGTLTKFIGEIEYLFINAIKIEYNYFVKKEQAKQEQLAIREQMRQEAEERKALEAERKKIEKEEEKYTLEITKLNDTLQTTTDTTEINLLKQRILELQSQLSDVVIKKNEVVNLQNGKAGTVYIISNLGAFGENVFKIGMTRRLDPQDRINELSGASVPFKFDVHSFIFSDDAVTLESKIHSLLNDKRVNKVNLRKEFFNTNIDELETLVEELDPTAEFNKTMIADEFRQSLSSDEVYTSDYDISDVEDE